MKNKVYIVPCFKVDKKIGLQPPECVLTSEWKETISKFTYNLRCMVFKIQTYTWLHRLPVTDDKRGIKSIPLTDDINKNHCSNTM